MEGFAVASNAAGLLNVGLVVCQELLSYYGSWEGAADDVRTMYTSIEALAKTLLCLKRSIEKGHLDAEVVKRVEEGITACENGISSLQKKLDKIKNITQANPKWMEKMKAQLQRTLYPFKESTLAKLKEICNDLRGDLVLALNTLQIDAASVSAQSLSELHTEISQISLDVKVLNTQLSQVSTQVDKTQSIQKDQYMSAILDWFSPLSRDFAMKQHETFNIPAKQDRLGEWILKTAEYQEWLLGSGKPLWCIGSQGIGKTVLASFIINSLITISDSNVGLAYLYCNYSEKDKQSATNLLKCILQQLASRTGVLDDDIARLYKAKSIPSFGTCCQLLHTAAIRLPKVYMVIDALDECTKATRDILLTELEKLRPKVCLIITSRHTFGCYYDPESAICLEIQAQEADIKQYLSERVETSRILQDHLKTRPKLRGQILDGIIAKANGMFLLARLHLDSLMATTTLRRLKLALDSLPKALDETYDQVLERIKSQDPDHATLALETLGWIHHAFRPLKTIELQHALAVEEGDSNFNADGIPDVGLILTVCAGIVAIREGNTMGFVHYTTEEYLERHSREHFPEAPNTTAKTCLTYLLFDEFASPIKSFSGYVEPFVDSRLLRDRLKKHPFLEYASRYWPDHARCISLKNIQGLALQFLGHEGKISSCLQAIQMREWSTEKNSGLAFAAEFGLYEISKALVEAGADVDAKNSRDARPLHKAAARGSEEVVLLLLEHRAEMEAKDDDGRTALHFAVENEHHDIVKVLIEKGADIGAKDQEGRTPLHRAIFRNGIKSMKLLIDSGADIKARDQEGRTLLHQTVYHGRIDSMQSLIDSGADIEDRDQEGCTLLHQTVYHGRIDSMQSLIDSGADIEARDQEGCTPLHHTVYHGRIDSMQSLIDSGADIEARDQEGKTPLYHAVFWRRIKSMKSLIDWGADIEARDQEGCTPLHHAAYYGRIEPMKSLINCGADIEARDQEGRTPLHHATYLSPFEPIKSLINWGANVHVETGDGRNALSTAAECGGYDTIKALLDSGADIKSRNMTGSTALHCAVRNGRLVSTQLLVDRGAQIDAIDTMGRTALHLAVRTPIFKVVEVLLQHGADPTVQDCDGQTPLDLVQHDEIFLPDIGENKVAKLLRNHLSSSNESEA